MFQAMQTKQDVWVQQRHHLYRRKQRIVARRDPGGVVRFLESLDGDLHELKLCLFSPQKPLGFFLPTCTCHWNKSQCQQEPQLICAFISSSYIIACSEVCGGNISHPQYFTLENKKSLQANFYCSHTQKQQAYKRAQPSGHCKCFLSTQKETRQGFQKVARSGQK